MMKVYLVDSRVLFAVMILLFPVVVLIYGIDLGFYVVGGVLSWTARSLKKIFDSLDRVEDSPFMYMALYASYLPALVFLALLTILSSVVSLALRVFLFPFELLVRNTIRLVSWAFGKEIGVEDLKGKVDESI